MAAFGGTGTVTITWANSATSTVPHEHCSACPTNCGIGYWDNRQGYMFVDRGHSHPLMRPFPGPPLPYYYPAAVRAPSGVPMAVPGVRLGMRWREYQRRR